MIFSLLSVSHLRKSREKFPTSYAFVALLMFTMQSYCGWAIEFVTLFVYKVPFFLIFNHRANYVLQLHKHFLLPPKHMSMRFTVYEKTRRRTMRKKHLRVLKNTYKTTPFSHSRKNTRHLAKNIRHIF